MTTAEYFRTPETLKPQELIYGVLRVADSPAVVHQRLVAALYRALHAHVDEHRLGEVLLSPLDVVFDAPKGLVLQPDLMFVSRDRDLIINDRVFGAPDLVIEVLSPRPRIGTLDERVGWFAQYGVAECWLVHQFERRVEVLSFAGGRVTERAAFTRGQRIASAVLPLFDRTFDSIAGW